MRSQFSRNEVNHNIEICKKRYTAEVVYSRISQTTRLNGIIPREHFHNVEYLVGWAHGVANICYGLLQEIDELIYDCDENN